jgi:hypothetical protein
MKEDGFRRDKGPEISSFALVFPAGFINVKGQGQSDILFDGAEYRHAGIGDSFGGIADGTGRDANAKKRLHNLRNTPAGDTMDRGQIGNS